jgi:hypothetical protein
MRPKLSQIIYVAQNSERVAPQAQLPDGGTIFVRHPTDEEIGNLYTLSQAEIGAEVAPLDLVLAVYKHNPDTFWGVYYMPEDTPADEAKFIGYYGFLHLNLAGEKALETGAFDALNPHMSELSKAGERPVIIYVWALVARRVARLATPLVARALGRDLYGGVPIYAKAGTLGGLNTIKHYGFVSARPSDFGLGDLFRLDPEVSGAVPG